MKSRVAEAVRRELAAEVERMPPAERLQRALELGERAVADYMRNFGVDRPTAIRVLRKNGRAGRRRSRCIEQLDE